MNINDKISAIEAATNERNALNTKIYAIQRELITEIKNNPPPIIEKSAYVIPDTPLDKSGEAPPDNAWRNQKHKKRVVARIQPTTSLEKNIQITENISLPATVVGDFADVNDDGKLYYIERANHFAMIIFKKLYHGNIGTIYTNEKILIKIKNCQYHSRDFSTKKNTCNYYHDPLIYPESSDVRNYVANSWLYQVSASDDHSRNRKFGSLSHIEDDITRIKADESSKLRDMVFHDLLCSFIASGHK